MSSYALDNLLPYADPGVQVDGAFGLRVAGVQNTDLHLTRVNSDGRLIVRGIPGTRWQHELSARWQELDEGGHPPLWQEPVLSSFEREDEIKHPRVRKGDRELAWLGSGLLRRIALFHTSSSAYSTRSWIKGDEWIFELDTRRDAPLEHDTLLARLTDPIWGLSLRISDSHCTCHNPPLPDRYMR
ncbi:hypothetical protein ACHZ99_29100, partial [Streptomyces sp. MAR4 CNX-425]